MDYPTYVAVLNSETGEIIGYINLETDETIRKEGIEIRLGFDEPDIIEEDGSCFMEV